MSVEIIMHESAFSNTQV